MNSTLDPIIEIGKMQDEIAKLVRRVDTLQKSVDLLYQDRSILEDMQGSIRGLQEILIQNRVHNETAIKDVKAEVHESSAKMTDQVAQVASVVTSSVGELTENISGKKTIVLVKEPWYKKIFKKREGVKK